MPLRKSDKSEPPKYPGTNINIRIVSGEIRLIGTENDLDMMIPALCRVFQVERVSERYPADGNRKRVYLNITGVISGEAES